jgi:hypothetical protein
MSDRQRAGLPPASPPMTPTPEERHLMVRVAAYYLAERRGFAPGAAEADWIAAEGEIERLLAAMARQGVSRTDYERVGLRHALRLWVT